jgi:DNA polymerase-3 subunit gamma/tau
MASQALYRKWRSQTFDELVGQAHVTHTLMNALKLGRVAHAYLFAGPRGTGKTSMARLLAKAVNCQAEPGLERPCNRCHICTAINEARLLDLIEIDAASNTGVDDIRDLRDKVSFRPAEARIKFYIIDEAHMLSNSAFNALLKTLEEPPDHVIFVLATTEPERIPATITSRCQRFEFKRIKLHEVTDRLAYIIAQEGFTAEPAALEYIARQGGGSMRDAISLLDQLTAYSSQEITLELVRTVLGSVASRSC